MTIRWKSAYKIGYKEIDAQHQTLFNKANAFMASIDDPMLDACADAFYEAMREHLSHEEALMLDIQYPALDGHVQQHYELLASLTKILEDVADANLSKQHLAAFLSDSFVAHMRIFDTQLAAFVRVM